MTDIERALDPERTIFDTIRMLLDRRGALDVEVTANSELIADLDLDSLELAELSTALEYDLGRDPFSEGIIPATVADLLRFYGI